MTEEQKINVRVGQNIRNIRKERGLSQGQTGKLIGVSFQQIQKYETGTNRVSAPKLVLLARELDVSLMDLFKGVEGV